MFEYIFLVVGNGHVTSMTPLCPIGIGVCFMKYMDYFIFARVEYCFFPPLVFKTAHSQITILSN